MLRQEYGNPEKVKYWLAGLMKASKRQNLDAEESNGFGMGERRERGQSKQNQPK